VVAQFAHGWRYRRLIDGILFLCLVAALGILAALFHIHYTHPSYASHFIAQDQRWLMGRLDVTGLIGHDYILINGKQYIVYPPGPALLMLPFVATLGSHFSDIWFTWLLGALNGVLTFRLLEVLRARNWTERNQREHLVLALTFCFGTIALWLTLGGTVWFTAQTLAITCILGMIHGTLIHRWWQASTCLGFALLTRSPDVLAGIFVLVAFIQSEGCLKVQPRWQWHWPSLQRSIALASPFLVALFVYMLHNTMYFGSPLDSGYNLQVQQNYPQVYNGLLSWHYIWPNFVVDFLNMPTFNFNQPFDITPGVDFLRGGNGMSIFFTTPLVLLCTLPAYTTMPRWLRITTWGTSGILLAFSLLWNGTGWYQVGARYLFDCYPFLWLLLGTRVGHLTRLWLALAAWGVVVNIVLANVFWCNNGACLGTSTAPRHILYMLLLLVVPVVAFLTWMWLHRTNHVTGQTIVAQFPAQWQPSPEE
jgi:hypothetical protein